MSGIEKAARFARVLAVAALVVVALASLAPDPRPPVGLRQLPVLAALAHVVMHFVVTVLCLAGWHDRAARVVPILALFAIAMEAVQLVVPGRAFSLGEMVGNLAGFGLGWAFFRSMRRFNRSNFF